MPQDKRLSYNNNTMGNPSLHPFLIWGLRMILCRYQRSVHVPVTYAYIKKWREFVRRVVQN